MEERDRKEVERLVARIRLDELFQQAMSSNLEEARGAFRTLEALCAMGRVEAKPFLVGLLLLAGDDWRRREELVRVMGRFTEPGLIHFLCNELRRVKNSNSTRRYLGAILDVLERMPAEAVEGELEALLEWEGLSRKIRARVERILWEMKFGGPHP